MEAALVLCSVVSDAVVTTILFTDTLGGTLVTIEAVVVTVEAAAAAGTRLVMAVEVLSEQEELISVTSKAKETCAAKKDNSLIVKGLTSDGGQRVS